MTTKTEKPDKFDLTDAWIDTIRAVAPKTPTVPPKARRRILMISDCKGFQHWVTPHTAAVIRVLAESGAFEVIETIDPMDFMPDKLDGIDGILFNNTCPFHERRDFFSDYIEDPELAETLKDSVIDFVAKGGGFIPVHGGNLAYMFCGKWERMQGMTFCHHPYQQYLTLVPMEPDHPLLKAFDGKPFVHFDEPYLFVCKYTNPDLRPLLLMDISDMRWVEKKGRHTGPCYAAWIKRYGQGRVFYSSPSHNAQSFEDPRLLQFMLDGIQYALGDLECDDASSPDAKASVLVEPKPEPEH